MSTVSPLRRLGHADRLSAVAHAAFLRAGFEPCGDDPTGSGHLLSRRYTVPQLARREEGAAAEVAVLEPRALGNGGGVAFQAFLITRDGGGVVFQAYLLPMPLPCRLADAAGAWLWRSLADWVPRGLLPELPLSRFASLPDDAVAEILKWLADAKDLARAECTSRQLQRVAAERDGELWKALYESCDRALMPWAWRSGPPVAGTWKESYVKARPRQRLWDHWSAFSLLSDSFNRLADGLLRAPTPLLRERHDPRAVYGRLRLFGSIVVRRQPPMVFFLPDPPAPAPAPAREVIAGGSEIAGRQHRKVARNENYRTKRHGAGAINSPSSRYRWNHR